MLLRSNLKESNWRETNVTSHAPLDQNLTGWEEVAKNWGSVGWPRRPRWKNEFDRVMPLISTASGSETLVFGATPEFRVWLRRFTSSRISLYEKSSRSLYQMEHILRSQFDLSPDPRELLIKKDWADSDVETNRFSLALGDIITGYLGSTDGLAAFLEKVYKMLRPKGIFILRDFVNIPFLETDQVLDSLPIDTKRWAAVLKPGVAIDGELFYESQLISFAKTTGDVGLLSTCASSPRTRLILPLDNFQRILHKSPFQKVVLIIPPASFPVQPGLWVLHK